MPRGESGESGYSGDFGGDFGDSDRGVTRNLNRFLLILRALMRWSSVDGGMPSFAAAPDGPDTRPRLSASAASTISRSLRGSPRTGAGTGSPKAARGDSLNSHNSSTANTSPELRITDRSITFCSSRMLPGQSYAR